MKTQDVSDKELLVDENIEKMIEEGEKQHECESQGMRYMKDGTTLVTRDYDWLRYVKRLERTAKVLASTDKRVIATVKRWDDVGYKLTSLGQEMYNFCAGALPLLERDKRGFILKACAVPKAYRATANITGADSVTSIRVIPNPHITVMLRGCMRVAKRLRGFSTPEWSEADKPEVRAAFEFAARFVRRVCRHKKFEAVLDNHRRSARKNLRSCLKYVVGLFQMYSKLLVLRIDLYIHTEHGHWSASDRAEWCITQYLRALREGRIIGPEVKGRIMKREGGVNRGIHFHLMVFLDGHKYQSGRVYGQQLGEAWMNRFSDGKGTYFNCWSLRDTYPYNALGVVNVCDRAMLTGIWKALVYMTKEDCSLETGRSRNLRRSILARPENKPKPGAPRKVGNDISVVMGVFASLLSR